MSPNVDLVVVFRTNSPSLSKLRARDDALKAEQQYSALLETLTKTGLRAVGRCGETRDQILVLISCPQKLLGTLARRERHSDFVEGLPISDLLSITEDFSSHPLTPADRLHLIHSYITSMTLDGGLGIIPGSSEWDRVDSVLGLHNREFNEDWIRLWTTRQITSVKVEKIREQFGVSVALYFSFLSSYTQALIFPAVLGTIFYSLDQPYSLLYSTLLLLWSIAFVEWWTIKERVLSVRWGTRGSANLEKRRTSYIPGFPWWKSELRVIASLPVILFFGVVLAVLLTIIFVLEAFVTDLYTGPGHKYIAFSPTILFIVLIPRVLAIYQSEAIIFTQWENHEHRSAYDASLTIKTFTLSAIVAYLGLALSAFVFVPFGGDVMRWVQHEVFSRSQLFGQVFPNGIGEVVSSKPVGTGVLMADQTSSRWQLNPSRLQDQMFAFTVADQIIDTFQEIGLPYILRFVNSLRNGKSNMAHGGIKKPAVVRDEVAKQQYQQYTSEKAGAESEKEGREDDEFLERVRSEVALPPYDLFDDYSEMATQFGYVALWSTIWPLAPVMALVNNFFELRSDAFKITHHNRRPLPMRADSIGPWLETLNFLTWLAALTNSALLYLFRDGGAQDGQSTKLDKDNIVPDNLLTCNGVKRDLLFKAVVIALAASHGYIVVRVVVKHILEKIFWAGCEEMEEAERNTRQMKEQYLKSIGEVEEENNDVDVPEQEGTVFWGYDEGLDEIRRALKDA